MTTRIKYILIVLLSLLAACEKDVKNAMVPVFVPKLVVTTFLSPSNRINLVYVSSNQRIFGDLGTRNPTGSLSGWISDGEKEIPLTYREGRLIFSQEELQVKPGKEYSIRIKNDSGLEAKGTCRVPVRYDFRLEADTLNTIKREGNFEWVAFKLKATFHDQPGTENYFRIHARYVTYTKNGYYKADEPLVFDTDLFKDDSFNTEGEVNVETNLNHPGRYIDSAFVKIYLLNTERSYYLYHKSLNEYSDEGNPFREARPVYTNITGGLGVITSYTCDSIIMRLK
jgi:hypothetical protein